MRRVLLIVLLFTLFSYSQASAAENEFIQFDEWDDMAWKEKYVLGAGYDSPSGLSYVKYNNHPVWNGMIVSASFDGIYLMPDGAWFAVRMKTCRDGVCTVEEKVVESSRDTDVVFKYTDVRPRYYVGYYLKDPRQPPDPDPDPNPDPGGGTDPDPGGGGGTDPGPPGNGGGTDPKPDPSPNPGGGGGKLPDSELPYYNVFDPETMQKFWGYLSSVLYLGMPVLLIIVAIFVVKYVLEMIVQTVAAARDKDDDDDDDDW